MAALISFEAVRAAVGIDAALGHYGHTPIRRGRSCCPVHGGRNPQAFAVQNNERFHCFNCGAHGDVIDLERALGGGEIKDALTRLCARHGIETGRVDLTAARRRGQRLQRLTAWWRERVNGWTTALVITEGAVREHQCEPSAAGEVWWDELDARCTARDRAEAMCETFAELRTVAQRANAFKAEHTGLTTYPWEAAE